MSRRERDYSVSDRYEERDADYYRRPRRDREYEDIDVDVRRSRHGDGRRGETVVKERDTVVEERRRDRGPRQPEFLREDYGRSSNSGQLVVREDVREEDGYRRRPSRRRSLESVRSRVPEERVKEERIVIEERERDRGPRLRDDVDIKEREAEEIIYRDRARSRPGIRDERSEEKIDITIRRDDRDRDRPIRDVRERDVEEVRIRRTDSDRPGPSRVVDREEIDIRERRSSPVRSVVAEKEIDIDIRERRDSPGRGRDREVVKEEIDIRETSRPERRLSRDRDVVVARKEEEWLVRRPRTPPPRDYEKEEIIIRRKERSISPEPIREPTPEPIVEPIYRPPIIQEVITHHHHIDHGFERARSPTPPPLLPSPPREDNLEIEIKRKGVRNGKAYEEDIVIDSEKRDGGRELVEQDVSRRRSVSFDDRRRSPSRRRFYEGEVAEADIYNRRVGPRGYLDGVGGGSREIAWQRYNGERKGRFIGSERIYEDEVNGYIGSPWRRGDREFKEEIRISEGRGDRDRYRRRDRMWTEVTKDLVIKEAIDERGYEYEETDEHFYIIEYLRYEDVLRLVELTEEIKRERRERIREIQWEREESERVPRLLLPAPGSRSGYDERVYEREYVIDRDGRRYR